MIEKDVFHYLLTGTQSVIMTLARGMKEKIETDLKAPAPPSMRDRTGRFTEITGP